MNFTIKYGTEQHDRVLRALQERYNLSYSKMSKRYEQWKKTDELFRAYQPETSADVKRRLARQAGMPQYTTLNIPYSYAVLLTAHTYWSSVFLSRNPILQYTARHGEAQQQVQMVEALLDYQVMVGRMIVPFYVWMLDAGKYGVGVLCSYWDEEKTWISEIVQKPVEVFGIGVPGVPPKKVKIQREISGYRGNKVFNVRPYDFFPDPRVSLIELQSGEFCGRRVAMSWNSVWAKAQGEDAEYFNIEELRAVLKSRSTDREMGSSQLNLPTQPEEDDLKLFGSEGFVDGLELWVRLVPRRWGLGASEYPEMWAFTIGQGQVIIRARPYGEDHDQFPFFVNAYEIDGYEQTSRGMIEIIQPLSEALSWMVNSHFFNVRKSLNDQFIVDPSRVVMKDITDGGPGRLVRVSPAAYGQDVRTIISQLPVMDITQGHLKEAVYFEQLMQRVTGATDNLQGMMAAGGRKTATEVRTSSSLGINRLKTFAEYNSALGWAPLSQVLLQGTQQHYDWEQAFRIAGDLLDGNAQKFLRVRPEDIQGFYDFVPVDGSYPIDRFAQANLWKEIILGLQKMPQIGMQYDLAGIFSWMAQLAGLKNISQFKIKVMPDQQLAAQAAAGNLVPLNGQGAGNIPPALPPGPGPGLGLPSGVM